MNTETVAAAIRIANALNEPTVTLEDSGMSSDLLAALVGVNVLIRTVTMIYTGCVDDMDAHTIVLSSAAWIADTGRFADALKTGVLSEVEPYPGVVYVARSSIVDVTYWDHDLPREQK